MRSRRAGSRRRASAEQIDGRASLQCRSSSTRTRGASGVSASTASAISRSMRSRVAPRSSRWSASRSCRVEEPRHLHEPGRRVPTQEGRRGARPPRRGEPAERVEHRQIRLAVRSLEALALRDRDARIAATRARKASTTAVLPMPASPVTNATWRLPRRAASSQVCEASEHRSRPTKFPAPSGRRCDGAGSACASTAGASRALPVRRRRRRRR